MRFVVILLLIICILACEKETATPQRKGPSQITHDVYLAPTLNQTIPKQFRHLLIPKEMAEQVLNYRDAIVHGQLEDAAKMMHPIAVAELKRRYASRGVSFDSDDDFYSRVAQDTRTETGRGGWVNDTYRLRHVLERSETRFLIAPDMCDEKTPGLVVWIAKEGEIYAHAKDRIIIFQYDEKSRAFEVGACSKQLGEVLEMDALLPTLGDK